jgi:hypothetical protein
MEVVGFIFGLLGFTIASSAMAKLRRLENKLKQRGVIQDGPDIAN